VTTHLLILGDKRGAAWVLSESRTALAKERVREVKKVQAGDRFLLYASNTAFGTANAGLFGHATVMRAVQYLPESFRMNFKTYEADIPLLIEGVVPLGGSVELGQFADRLDIFSGNREKWGVYLRRPVVTLGGKDTALLEEAVMPKCGDPTALLPDYLK
jgi:hypothetical protein